MLPTSMKHLLILTALLLSSVAVVADRAPCSAHGSQGVTCATDDPPPEPVDCPMCGGDPALHARRVFAVGRVGAGVVVSALRW